VTNLRFTYTKSAGNLAFDDVVVTGGDTELVRAVGEGFHRAGLRVVLAGADAEALERAARDLQAEAVVCDTADPSSLAHAQAGFPHDLDAVVIATETGTIACHSGSLIFE
jgi:NAD(P)-dependent dehydrogenase (short-subunit alcohol dehydrogenase family)